MDRSQETRSQREVRKNTKGTPDLENKTKKGPEEEGGERGVEAFWYLRSLPNLSTGSPVVGTRSLCNQRPWRNGFLGREK